MNHGKNFDRGFGDAMGQDEWGFRDHKFLGSGNSSWTTHFGELLEENDTFLNSIDDVVGSIGAGVCNVVVGLVEIEQCQLSPKDFHGGLGL